MLRDFQQRIGYYFKNIKLLEEALTHSSMIFFQRQDSEKIISYERLEFLGDAVLSMVLTDFLFSYYDQEQEGDLTRRLSALICGDTLVNIAQEIGIPSVLRVSEGEEKTGGRYHKNILEAVVEAVIGAIYLDGGLEEVRGFIMKFWGNIAVSTAVPPLDYKNQLQEFVQAKGKKHPTYVMLKHSSSPPLCQVKVVVQDFGAVEASAPSRKQAEKEAAKKMLSIIKEKCNN